MNDYHNKTYKLTIRDRSDELTVEKSGGHDWSEVRMETNGAKNGEITLRSRNHAESLHFMLTQLLSKPKQ
jgi:hypothetical protein